MPTLHPAATSASSCAVAIAPGWEATWPRTSEPVGDGARAVPIREAAVATMNRAPAVMEMRRFGVMAASWRISRGEEPGRG